MDRSEKFGPKPVQEKSPLDPENFINPGAAVIDRENAQLLHEFVHPNYLPETTLVEEDIDIP